LIRLLQGLRTLAMLVIFLFHAGLLLNGTFLVISFFILSGFGLYYIYSNKINTIKIKENIFWVKLRMNKMYPIHIITFLMSIFIRWDWILELNLRELVINSLLNIFLLQTLFSRYAYSFNGLYWFLSVTLILYTISLSLILIVKKNSIISPNT